MNWETIKNKLFPSGFWVFLIPETISILLQNIFSLPFLFYLGYILIGLYIIYLCIISSEKNRIFSLPLHIQWLVLFIIPLISFLCALLYLKVSSSDSKLTVWFILIKGDSATFVSAVFFLSVVIVWSCLMLIKHFLNRDKYFAYAATCIPIKDNSSNDKISLCLINNHSHNESAWMFPGGHIDLTKNYYNEKDSSLSNLSIIPEKIVKKKAMIEAGLEELSFISLSDFRGNVRQLETARSLYAPAFNYLFKVNKSANCHSILRHRVHLDFTYVATYKNINTKSRRYETYEFELSMNGLPDSEKDAISMISHILEEKINEYTRNGDSVKPAHNLFPDSIPEMIYCACRYYQAYLMMKKEQSK